MVAEDRPVRPEPVLRRAADYVSYEYCQVFRQIDRFAMSALADRWPDDRHLSHSRLIRSDVDAHMRMHLMAFRNLVGFLGEPRRDDDVVASDFIRDIGVVYEVEEPASLRGYTDHFNKRAGHLTYKRGAGVAFWEPIAGARWLVDVMGQLIRVLTSYDRRDGTSRADWFLEAQSYAEETTELLEGEAGASEAFVESPTGAFLTRSWTITLPRESGDPELIPPPRFPSLWGRRDRPLE